MAFLFCGRVGVLTATHDVFTMGQQYVPLRTIGMPLSMMMRRLIIHHPTDNANSRQRIHISTVQ
jgi:hypothetical protein